MPEFWGAELKKYSAVPAVIPPDATLLTISEVAVLLRLSVSAIRAWVLQRRIPYIKLQNKAIRFRRADIDALIASSSVPAKT